MTAPPADAFRPVVVGLTPAGGVAIVGIKEGSPAPIPPLLPVDHSWRAAVGRLRQDTYAHDIYHQRPCQGTRG